MYPLLETLRIEQGRIHRLAFHNQRMNQARHDCFHSQQAIDLSLFLQPEPYQKRTKCRVVYRDRIEQIEYHPYTMPQIRSLRLVTDDRIDYTYKSTDRTALNRLYEQRKDCDDILIIRNGLLTDTSFCNVALWNGAQWETPLTPLLEGTCRRSLLEEGKIIATPITEKDLDRFSRICLFNAMIDWGEIEFPFIKQENTIAALP